MFLQTDYYHCLRKYSQNHNVAFAHLEVQQTWYSQHDNSKKNAVNKGSLCIWLLPDKGFWHGRLTDPVEYTVKIRLSWKVFQNIVFEDRDLSAQTKLLVYRAIVLPTLQYGAESLTPYSRHLRAMEQYHQRSLWKILGISWKDRRTNISIFEEANMTRIPTTRGDAVKIKIIRLLSHYLNSFSSLVYFILFYYVCISAVQTPLATFFHSKKHPKSYLVSENRRYCCARSCFPSARTHTSLSLSLHLLSFCSARGREEQSLIQLNTDISCLLHLILHASIAKITAQLLSLAYGCFI